MIDFNPSISNKRPIKDVMTLFDIIIHAQTSAAAALKYGDGNVISSHTLWV